MFKSKLFNVSLTGIFSTICPLPLYAQVVPDNTLGAENSTIRSINDLRDAIEGGAIRGDNLFHSFEQFSVEQGARVDFTNPQNISNIFSRVTGGDVSEIFGTLGVDGTANLFFINPSGIVFGENAAINIGGSFIATTAESIDFNGGDRFSAVAPEEPLLTIDFPIGLGMASNSGYIEVNGSGHSLTLSDTSNISNAFNSPVVGWQEISTGLIGSEQNFAFIGNEVLFDGGVVANRSGRIEVGSVANGRVGIGFDSSKEITFDYSQVSLLGNVLLDNRSLLDVSGTPAGDISVNGKDISVNENSLIFSSNFGNQPSGDIKVNARGLLSLSGINSPNTINSSIAKPGIISQSLQSGDGADIHIRADNINLQNFSSITSATYTSGLSGTIDIKVDDSVTIVGISPVEGIPFLSGISSINQGLGKGGDINISGRDLSLQEGGLIVSQAFQQGKGGNINIDFLDSIKISGSFLLDPFSQSYLKSTISTTTLLSKGGNITLKTPTLELEGGGRISSTTSGSGSAGDTTVDVAESVEIEGMVSGSGNNSPENASQIIASSEITNPFLIELFNLPSTPEGSSGFVILNTKQLSVTNGGRIGVQNAGTGDAGNMEISAESIDLDSGKISASTVSGEGGNILLNTQDLELLNQSQITATAGGTGNGGNIEINSDNIIGSNNSDITANAFQGDGGNIEIDSNVILGISESESLTPQSDITADSELGIDGTVNINSPDTNADDEVLFSAKSPEPDRVKKLFNSSCLNPNRSRLARVILRGRGLPETPYNYFDRPTEEIEPPVEAIKKPKVQPEPQAQKLPPVIIEPNAIEVDDSGRRFLVALTPKQIQSARVCQQQLDDTRSL